MELNWKDHIETNPKIMFGKPVIIGTRIPVDLILKKLSMGEKIEQLLIAYPSLKKESIYACLVLCNGHV
ncbi:MAG: DUF433 domain-containing protein [Bacteroidota bacterium]|nr:DUF433 domain-containing protein [Bacteroidota bacterium]